MRWWEVVDAVALGVVLGAAAGGVAVMALFVVYAVFA
jgi:hypothetical protein